MTKCSKTIVYNLIVLSFLLQVLTGCGFFTHGKPPASTGKVTETGKKSSTINASGSTKRTTTKTSTYNSDTRPDIDPDGKTSNSPTNGIGPTPSTVNPDPSGNDPGIPGIDLEGRTVKISVWPTYTPAEDRSVKNWLRDTRTNMYNFSLEYETGGQWDTLYINFTSAFLSGLWFADVIMVSGEQAFPYMVSRGMIHPLDEYLNFGAGLYANVFQTNTLWKGRHYGIQEGLIYPNNLITYNKDVIRAAGQPDPQTLQQQGIWNFSNFKSIANVCAADKNGDGKNDIWGISILSQDVFTRNMLHANGGDYTRIYGGKYTFALDEPVALQTLNFISELLNYDNIATADNGASFYNGQAAFTSEVLRKNTKVPPNCGVVFYPKGDNIHDYTSVITGQPFYAFPVNSEIPAEKLVPVLADMWAYWNLNNERSMSFEDHIIQWTQSRAVTDNDIPTLIDAALYKLKIPAHSNFMMFTNLCETQIFSKLSSSAPIAMIIDSVKPQASAYLEQYN